LPFGAAALFGLLLTISPGTAHAAPSDIPTCRPAGWMKIIVLAPADDVCGGPTASEGYGWVLANDATSTERWGYQPLDDYQFNSVRSGPVNRVLRIRAGEYSVFLPGLLGEHGSAHVTAYGGENTATRCKLAGVSAITDGEYLTVHCFDLTGKPRDSQFTALYTNLRTAAYPFGFANPDGVYNSGGSNPVTFSDTTGIYRVAFAGLTAPGGTVMVTADGAGPDWCKAGTWYPDATGMVVDVRCFTPYGAPADADFSVTFVNQGNLAGELNAPGGLTSAYTWVNPGLAEHVIDPTWSFATPPSPSPFDWWAVGPLWNRFQVKTPVPAMGGDVQATAQGFDPSSCVLTGWNPATGTDLRCYWPDGSPIRPYFEIAYLGGAA
jgi:hypothetical protein